MIKLRSKNKSVKSKELIDKVMIECEQYRNDLIRYCYQYFEYEYEYAEDCIQEAYLALYENLSKGIEISNYKSWLIKVILNYKNKAIKDKIKRNEKDFNNSEEKESIINNAITYEPDYVEQIISDETIEERMMIIISKLNKDEQNLYFLHYRDKKNFKEISKEMSISHTAARQRHVELKRKIMKLIKEYEEN